MKPPAGAAQPARAAPPSASAGMRTPRCGGCSVARMNHRIASLPALPRHAYWRLLCLWLAGCCAACAPDSEAAALGSLALGLTTQSDGVSYRLTDARFTLSGPEPRELEGGTDSELSVPLPAGAYGLTLHDGYSLARVDGDGARLSAQLVSPNPLPVLIGAGETTRATLRFVLADGSRVTVGAGTLQVGVEVGDAAVASEPAPTTMRDAAVASAPALDEPARACRAGLRINEIDYEQPSSDEAEFVELLNPGSCDARLEGLRLELVNGTGGKVYGRYALADAAAILAAGERLVVGDPSLLAGLGSRAKQLPLSGSGLQNGPDGVRLVDGARVLDAVSYKGAVTGSDEGTPAAHDDGATSLSRCPDGSDQDDNGRDFRAAAPTPGGVNACDGAQPVPEERDGARAPDAGREATLSRDAGRARQPLQNTSATMPSSSSQR
jgi:hypothetical protein